MARRAAPFATACCLLLLLAAAVCLLTNHHQTQPNPKQQPDAPLSLSGTCESLATLVWQVAAKENQLDKVQDELAQVAAAFHEQPDLARVAVDPFMPVKAKAAIMNALFKDSQATEIVKRLFVSLAEENALAASLKVSEAYDQLMLAHKKEVHCTIVTAAPLDKLERADLRKQAAKFVEPGFNLVMQEKVDPKLLGGFVLEFEDRLVDMSVAKKLEEFNGLVLKLEGDLRA
jgi:F-type H+-transporting ATPase subunit O